MALTMDPPIAVALVVDASLSLASQWQVQFPAYIGHLLKRLTDANPQHKPYLGFICYATAETRPSPIICKRFFHEFSVVIKMLRDEYAKAGVGSCGSTGRGTVALDALVAVLEMFDTLAASYKPSDPSRAPVCHVIHITASPIDESIYPNCNDNPALDDVTWETLPSEMKKRNVHYSCICLGVDIPAIRKLHQASDNKTQPWFNILPNNTVFLSGYPQLTKALSKRAADPSAVKYPEAKRVKTETPTAPSKPTHTAPTLPTNPPAPSAPSPTHPPAAVRPPGGNLPMNASLDRQLEFMERYALFDSKMRVMQKAVNDVRATGDHQRAELMAADVSKQLPAFQKMRGIVQYLLNNPQFAQYHGQYMQRLASVQAAGPLNVNSGAPSLPQPPAPPSMPPNMPGFTPPQAMGHARVNSGESKGMNISAGMHGAPPLMGGPGPSRSPPNTNMLPQMPPQPQPQPPQPGSAEGRPPSNPLWHGPLCWSGLDTNGKREVKAHVTAFPQNNVNFFVETWPDALMLSPTQQPAVSMMDMQVWAKKTQPALCVFIPQQAPTIVDKATNDAHFKSLIQLLLTKKIFAVAAWTLPNGSRNPGCLLFPSPTLGLLGAFFPKTGIPEMPQPSTTNTNLGPNLNLNLPPQVEQQLQKMSQEDRNAFKAKYAMKVWQMQNAGMQQAQSLNQAGGMSVMPVQQQQQQQQQQQGGVYMNSQQQQMGLGGGVPMNNMGQSFNPQGPVAGMPRPMGGGGMNGFSNEIMQSFMQRNQEGGSG